MTRTSRHARPSPGRRIALLTLALFAPSAAALEFSPGGYDPLPKDSNLAMLYFQQADRDSLYRQGRRVDGAGLDSTVAIFRYIRGVALSERTVFEPQIIVPYARLTGTGSTRALGSGHGLGDIAVATVFVHRLDEQGRNTIGIGPFLYLPTGRYSPGTGLNVGENRWRALLQIAYTHRFSDTWALDVGADASKASRNKEWGPQRATLKEQTRFEYQAHLRYQMDKATMFALTLGQVEGAATNVDGIARDDRRQTTYTRLTLTRMMASGFQLQAQLGRDLRVREGFAERARFNMRLAWLF